LQLSAWEALNQPALAVAYYLAVLCVLLPMAKRWRSPYPFAVLYTASYVVAQYTSPKLTYFFKWVVPGGNVPFVATIALMDVIVVVWGLSVARQVIVAGFLAQVLLTATNALTLLTPSPPWLDVGAAKQFLGTSARVAIASPVAYLACELLNAYVTWRFRRVWWMRTMYSDPLALFVDTLVFTPLAFYGSVPSGVLLDMVVGLTALKLSLIPVNLMAVYLVRATVERALLEEAEERAKRG